MTREYDLPQYTQIHTRDFSAFKKEFGGIWRPYRRLERLGSGQFEVSMQVAALSQLALTRVDLKGGVVLTGGQLQDVYTIAIPLKGSLEFRLGDQKLEVSGMTGSVYSVGHQHEIRVTNGVSLINARIQREALEKELETLLGRRISAPILFEMKLDLRGEPGQQIQRLLRYLVAEVNALYPSVLTESLTLRHTERTLLILLLEHQHHNYTEEMRHNEEGSTNWQVLRAEEYVKLNLERPITVGDVAKGAGVSERTLSSAFKKNRGCTPVQFIRQSKLEAVNQELLSARTDDSVTEIANRWGFVHSGHFAENYFNLFGETPSQTLKHK